MQEYGVMFLIYMFSDYDGTKTEEFGTTAVQSWSSSDDY